MPHNAMAFEVPNGSHPDAKKPGAYWFMYKWNTDASPMVVTDQRIGIGHSCPCGCGAYGHIWFKGGSMNGHGSQPDHEWDVQGEWPKVTLSPSIGFLRLKSGGYHWHGYLIEGEFREC